MSIRPGYEGVAKVAPDEGRGRATFAWLLACLSVGPIFSTWYFAVVAFAEGVQALGPFWALPSLLLWSAFIGGVIAAALSAALAWLAVMLVRSKGWRRGWSDGAFGAVLPTVVVAAFYVGTSSTSVADASSIFGFLLLAGVAISGALSGVIYWIAAGRPRPPYVKADTP